VAGERTCKNAKRDEAMIRAVVLDIGSVLEIIDDTIFPAPFEQRHGLGAGAVEAAIHALPAHPGLGGVTEAETREHWRRELELTEAKADELMADYWRWYVGTLDQELFDWFAGQRPARKTGILSNSGPGAREAERCWGFEEITDDIVYSHEVGLLKPDPRIYALATERLDVRPHEVVFLDDVAGHVAAARAAGWHAVVHGTTAESIREIEQIVAEQALRP
jgi:HAD superfamily hydrolase (TIGR01509 family)